MTHWTVLEFCLKTYVGWALEWDVHETPGVIRLDLVNQTIRLHPACGWTTLEDNARAPLLPSNAAKGS